MIRCILLLAVLSFSDAYSQSRLDLLIFAHGQRMESLLIADNFSSTLSVGGFRFGVGLRKQLGESKIHVIAKVSACSFQLHFAGYPPAYAEDQLDVRNYFRTDYATTILLPAFELQYAYEVERMSYNISAGFFTVHPLKGLQETDSRIEYYSWDSTGALNEQPDSIFIADRFPEKTKFRIPLKAGVYTTASVQWRLSDRLALFAEATLGYGFCNKFALDPWLFSGGAGVAYTLNRKDVK